MAGPRDDDPVEAPTLPEMFLRRTRIASPHCLRSKVHGRWVDISTDEVRAAVAAVAAGLAELGVRRGDRVALLSENRPQWLVADHAMLALGVVSVPIYTTLIPDAIAYILADAGCVGAFASTRAQAAKFAAIRDRCSELRFVIAMDADARDAAASAREARHAAMGWEELDARGRERLRRDPELLEREARAARPEDLATLIYTSGTTGEPKGVMLTHDNLMSNVRTVTKLSTYGGDDSTLCILPLSHVYERMADFGYFSVGATIAYAESIEKVGENLIEVKPTIVAAVPRLYEKIYARVMERGRSGGALRRRIFGWAMGVAREWSRVAQTGSAPPAGLRFSRAIADRVVFSKIRERTGGRVRIFVSGSAPLAREIHDLFFGLGLPIYEGYGLSETSPVVTVNLPGAMRLGSVGRPIPGVEVRIAEDGEILVRGPNVMQGYYRKPDLTREVMADGWFHTGDVGHLDADGYLFITDRKKDLIKTSGGKYVAPQPIENALKADDVVAQAIVVGESRKFVGVLIVPNPDAVRARLAPAALPADPEALAADPRVRELLDARVAAVNATLSPHERIKKLAVLPRELTAEDGALTPTLKVRRRVIHERYSAQIDRFYEE